MDNLVLLVIIGDIYGKTGRRMLAKFLPRVRDLLKPDWVIANAENATGGVGLSLKHYNEIRRCGVDLMTSGNHFFGRSDWHDVVLPRAMVLRPHNLGGEDIPGSGLHVMSDEKHPPLAVVNLAGRIFMDHGDCPFLTADRLLSRIDCGCPVIVDFHAEATSEKIALSWYLDGRVTMVCGTHTHVQTSDARILPGGTGAITDIGMTGPADGILGVDRDTVIYRFLHGYSEKFFNAAGPGKMEGVLASLCGKKIVAIKPFRFHESSGIEQIERLLETSAETRA